MRLPVAREVPREAPPSAAGHPRLCAVARVAGEGVLLVAGMPIGDVQDASARLLHWLVEADVVAAEDTRRLRAFLARAGLARAGPITSFFEGNEARRTASLLAELTAGRRVLLVSDAGMPGVSDPGERLVAAAADAGVAVHVLPGPSAVTTALVASGLPTDRFTFEGFLPRTAAARRRAVQALAAEPRTMIFFESPRRLGACLDDLAVVFGRERPAAVCRELTKRHEEVLRAPLGALAERFAEEALGEVTIVVSGAGTGEGAAELAAHAEAAALERVPGLVATHQHDGLSRRDAITAVAQTLGLRRRDVYAAAVGAHREGRSP